MQWLIDNQGTVEYSRVFDKNGNLTYWQVVDRKTQKVLGKGKTFEAALAQCAKPKK